MCIIFIKRTFLMIQGGHTVYLHKKTKQKPWSIEVHNMRKKEKKNKKSQPLVKLSQSTNTQDLLRLLGPKEDIVVKDTCKPLVKLSQSTNTQDLLSYTTKICLSYKVI